MKKAVAVIVLASQMLIGCTSYRPPVYPSKADPDSKTGRWYCQKLSETAKSVSAWEMGWGITLGLIGSAGIILGTAMGPSPDPNANWVEKNRGTLIISTSALLAIPATILLMRGDEASKASAASGKAMALEDKAAYDSCVDVRADWIGSRKDASAVWLKRAEEDRKRIEKLEDEMKDLKKKVKGEEQPASLPAEANKPNEE